MVLGMFLGFRSRNFLSQNFQSHVTIVALYFIGDCFSSVSATCIFSCSYTREPNSILVLVIIYIIIKLIFYCWCRHRIIPIFNTFILILILFKLRIIILLIPILFKLLFPSKSSRFTCISSSAKVCSFFLWIVRLIIKVVIVFICLIVCSIVI